MASRGSKLKSIKFLLFLAYSNSQGCFASLQGDRVNHRSHILRILVFFDIMLSDGTFNINIYVSLCDVI